MYWLADKHNVVLHISLITVFLQMMFRLYVCILKSKLVNIHNNTNCIVMVMYIVC